MVGVSGFGVVSTGTEMKEQRKIIVQIMSKEEARVFHQILALIQWLTICVESRWGEAKFGAALVSIF